MAALEGRAEQAAQTAEPGIVGEYARHSAIVGVEVTLVAAITAFILRLVAGDNQRIENAHTCLFVDGTNCGIAI